MGKGEHNISLMLNDLLEILKLNRRNGSFSYYEKNAGTSNVMPNNHVPIATKANIFISGNDFTNPTKIVCYF